MEEQSIEMLGLHLANRAYLYRIFHIVFGAEPSSEELRVLGSPETAAALQVLDDTPQKDAAHLTLCDAAPLCATLGEKADDAAFVEVLKADFTRLFLVPGVSYVHPWESPYLGKETMLFQESTLDVRHRYAEYGFIAQEFGHFPEDHVSMMLDFLAHMSSRAFDLFAEGKDDEVKRILTSQKDFIQTHLQSWLSDFYEALGERDERGIYRQFAGALRALLVLDERFIEHALLKLDLTEQ